jgi:hypothetical protein
MPAAPPLRAAVALSCLIAFQCVAAPMPELVQKNGKFALSYQRKGKELP